MCWQDGWLLVGLGVCIMDVGRVGGGCMGVVMVAVGWIAGWVCDGGFLHGGCWLDGCLHCGCWQVVCWLDGCVLDAVAYQSDRMLN